MGHCHLITVMHLTFQGHCVLPQVTPQALEQPSSSGASTAAQQPGTSPAAPDVTPQKSPKHSAAATDPTRMTPPPQTIDRHASVDASSPVSVASADLESSQDIVTGQSPTLPASSLFLSTSLPVLSQEKPSADRCFYVPHEIIGTI